jgi:hypothetical protein
MVAVAILCWIILFTLYYFRSDILYYWCGEDKAPATPIAAGNIIGTSHTDFILKAEKTSDTYLYSDTKNDKSDYSDYNNNVDTDINNEDSDITIENFDAEYSENETDLQRIETEYNADNEEDDEYSKVIEPVNKTIEELHSDMCNVIKTLRNSDAAQDERYRAGAAMKDLQGTDLLGQLSLDVSGKERVDAMMQEFERVWNANDESQIDDASIESKNFEINKFV